MPLKVANIDCFNDIFRQGIPLINVPVPKGILKNICTCIGSPNLITISTSCAARRELYMIILIYNTKALDTLKKLYQTLSPCIRILTFHSCFYFHMCR